MTAQPPRVVKSPTREEMREAFDLYTAAVGRVAHAWNYLHEELARLFARIVGSYDYDIQHSVALAVWHSSFNDRAQRSMLEAAIKAASGDPAWTRLPMGAREDLLWLIERTHRLGDKRDEAVHAPCALLVDHDGSAMAANILSGHRRARTLTGKSYLRNLIGWSATSRRLIDTRMVHISR
jgi:hypothetical protein